MATYFYVIHENKNILLAEYISVGLAAYRLDGGQRVALATAGELQELAARRKKLLHVVGVPLNHSQTPAWRVPAGTPEEQKAAG